MKARSTPAERLTLQQTERLLGPMGLLLAVYVASKGEKEGQVVLEGIDAILEANPALYKAIRRRK
jgi:hypothetical protein